jgi:predicted ATPase
MLTRVEITDLRCIRHAVLELGRLTTLVGPNASGKSTVLTALEPGRQVLAADHRLKQQEHVPRVSYTWGGKVLPPVPRGAAPFLFQSVRLDVQALRQPVQVQPMKRYDPNGLHLSNVIATMPRRRQAQLAVEFCERIRCFADVDLRPYGSGHHWPVFQDRWSPSLWYTPPEVSDGTLLFLALLTLSFLDESPDVIAIEEPERGLHPYLMGQVVELLRSLQQPETGRPIQVVTATHSPELLSYHRPEEVRFLSRSAEDGTVSIEAAPTDDPGWSETFARYETDLASAWLAGGLGGVPGT